MRIQDGGITCLKAGSAGRTAEKIVSAAGELRAFAVFDGSVYLEEPRQGALFCLLPDTRPPGPLHLLCRPWPAPPRRLLAACARLARHGDRFEAADFVLDVSALTPWRPPEPPPPHPDSIRRAGAVFRRLVPELAPPDSLARAILLHDSAATRQPAEKALRAGIRQGLEDWAEWLAGAERKHPAPEKLGGFVNLLGLGPGLTPSGDDVIAGSLLALHALRNTESLAALIAALKPAWTTRTNRISAAHLAAAADGAGAAPFHACLASFLAGGIDLPAILPELNRIGHHSGWDALLGMAWTLEHASV